MWDPKWGKGGEGMEFVRLATFCHVSNGVIRSTSRDTANVEPWKYETYGISLGSNSELPKASSMFLQHCSTTASSASVPGSVCALALTWRAMRALVNGA